MAKAKDVLRRMVALADGGKLSDERINEVLNGMEINGTHEYWDGRLKCLKSGVVTTLSPDRIVSVRWPVPVPVPVPKKRDAGIEPKPISKPFSLE